ncbi:TonB-dependent receptor [candidate division KSB1 bacterium]|nr:TonB-dependent receptor [candidate division KSB1 bacterium]
MIAGFRWSRGDLFSLALTGYYKSYQNLSKSITDDPLFITGSGHSRGLETEASATLYDILLRGFYTLAKSDRRFGHITYPANTDIRHKIAGEMRRKISRLQVSTYWEFHTGQPYNPGRFLAAIETLHPGWDNEREKYDAAWGVRIVELDVPKDKMRYPPYHRLDVHIRLPLVFKGRALCPYISIQNLYNRKNIVYFLNSGVDHGPDGYTFGQQRIVSGRVISAGVEIEW